MPLVFVFILGLVFGSFLLVVASRLPRGESFFKGRSRCEHCLHELSILDLIPVASYITLNGKCRYCKRKLSLEYPISELLTGVLFTLTFYMTLNNSIAISFGDVLIQLVFNFFIVSVLIIIFFADIRQYIIPFQVLLPAILLVLIWQLYSRPEQIINFLLAGVGAFLFFLLIFLLTKGRGMGFGDVVLAFFMGVLLGFPSIIVGLYIAFLTGAIISLILIVRGKKKLKGGIIPFGPFLILGTYVALFWGDVLSLKVLSYLGL